MDMRSEDTILNDLQNQAKEEGNNQDNNLEEELPLDPETFDDQEFEGLKEDDAEGESTNAAEMLRNENAKLLDENQKLSNELETLKDRLLRTSAEYENYRRRTAKEKEGIYTDAVEDVLKNMFPVLDNLERASLANGTVEDLKKGIEMTIRQFKASLEKLQVEEIPSEGDFDPNLHNAVMHVEDENYGKNAVVEVFQKGYKKGAKVLRHSMVKVAN